MSIFRGILVEFQRRDRNALGVAEAESPLRWAEEKLRHYFTRVAPSDCCHTAAEVERVRAQHIIRSVEKIAGERMNEPYWAGFSQACEEILHRISDGDCNPWDPTP